MIKFSKETDYALQLLEQLSKSESVLSLAEFSANSNISLPILQKIARSLKKDRLIVAHRGKNGGYTIARPIEKISLKDVVSAMQMEYGVTECTKKVHGCKLESQCNAKRGFELLHSQVNAIMESTTLDIFFHTEQHV
ncbi:MAG: hypothetical protein COV59_02900 [Candidatus Magasanikbacteria bacterium CG11_big_fil_rev_8_21_14_0_20_39_34]|uniref:Transcriptional regulator n=1 Tax=Candidatus Magasanikbacteria bacterium CG11_big_fil_rev_8_21_14_0_20_39_34 TaxID=1974653 RepID=A0A2H0N5D6_9BACT|nr:MAG: hypothetical protein COV59_02900 [Candidatus Magasanikbacteria bacterium CG11_big_fil_rev_8_21_14_0_20_39_34]